MRIFYHRRIFICFLFPTIFNNLNGLFGMRTISISFQIFQRKKKRIYILIVIIREKSFIDSSYSSCIKNMSRLNYSILSSYCYAWRVFNLNQLQSFDKLDVWKLLKHVIWIIISLVFRVKKIKQSFLQVLKCNEVWSFFKTYIIMMRQL